MLEVLLLSFIVTLAACFILQRKRRFSLFKDLGIPGPPPSFLSGNLSEIIQKGSLITFKEWLDKYGDIVGFYNGAHPFIMVKDPELIRKIQIKDFNNFRSRGIFSGFTRSHPIISQSMVLAEGDRWKKMRSLLTPAFTTSNMKKMTILMDDSSNELLDIIESLRSKQKAIEFRELFQRLAADVLIRSAFGLKFNLQRKDRTNSSGESLFQESLKSFQQFRHAWINFLTAASPSGTLPVTRVGAKRFIEERRIPSALIGQRAPEVLKTILFFCQEGLKESLETGLETNIEMESLLPKACFPEFALLWTTVMSCSSRLNKTATDNIFNELSPIVQFRRVNRKNNGNDLMQLMLNAEVEDEAFVDVHTLTTSVDSDIAYEEKRPVKANDCGKKCFLTNTEILANGFTFFVAGFETTASAMAYTAYLLAKHQDIQDRLRKEVLAVLERDGTFTYDNAFSFKYLDQVISESLRFYPPVIGFTTRGCARDYAHKGITIPAGTNIIIPTYHMSHDPSFWKQHEIFDPERFSPENKGEVDPVVYQPFGQGPRNCVGIRFAQLEMKLTIAKLLAKYKLVLDERHIKEKVLNLESTFVLAYPKNGIWLKLEKI